MFDGYFGTQTAKPEMLLALSGLPLAELATRADFHS